MEAIRDGSCIAVTDGLYMRALYPQIHSASFILECSNGRGWLWGSFPEASQSACSYRGELVGLMVIHLILLVIDEINTNLTGLVHIYSDCLGALEKVKNSPPSQIPTGNSYLDVLKNILVNCNNLTFDRYYSHVEAHQDDHKDSLSQPLQLNCSMDYLAKKVLWDLQVTQPPSQQAFPLKPICIFASPTKNIADMGDYVHFWTHCQLTRERFHNQKILSNQELITWSGKWYMKSCARCQDFFNYGLASRLWASRGQWSGI